MTNAGDNLLDFSLMCMDLKVVTCELQAAYDAGEVVACERKAAYEKKMVAVC